MRRNVKRLTVGPIQQSGPIRFLLVENRLWPRAFRKKMHLIFPLTFFFLFLVGNHSTILVGPCGDIHTYLTWIIRATHASFLNKSNHNQLPLIHINCQLSVGVITNLPFFGVKIISMCVIRVWYIRHPRLGSVNDNFDLAYLQIFHEHIIITYLLKNKSKTFPFTLI